MISVIDNFKEWIVKENILQAQQVIDEKIIYKQSEHIFMHGYQVGYKHGDEDAKEPSVYCEKCGSCGESGCCSPDRCRSVQLQLTIKSVLTDMIPDEEFNLEYFLDQLVTRFNDGSYCDHNIKEYKEMAEECNKYYLALEKITKATYASEMLVIANEAIK